MSKKTAKKTTRKKRVTKKAAKKTASSSAYERRKKAAIERSREETAKGREIGPLPKIVDKRRRENATKSFRNFCEVYLPHLFSLAWSCDHLKAIERIEGAVVSGGKFALAMPRGSGKTTLLLAAMLWGALTGRIKHGVLVGATAEAANQLLDDIKTELEGNEEGPDFLGEDWPEVCFPIRQLDGIHARCRGQLLDGKRTKIQFVKNGIILPSTEGSAASGAIIVTRGITSGIRGLKKKGNRPDCVLLDDPQTDLSAKSVEQTRTRKKIIDRGIKGLAGPGKKLALLAAVTVIEQEDLATALLDRKKSPSWHGEKFKLLYRFPDDMDIWQQYADVRFQAMMNAGSDDAADEACAEFYKKNRKKMDKGAAPAWEERHEPGELSAVQNCMNLYFDDRPAFEAEYQNEPMAESEDSVNITEDHVKAKIVKTLKRYQVPAECQHLTLGIDVQKNCLFFALLGWTDQFSGHLIDCGTFPDQKTSLPFFVSKCRYTLEKTYKNIELEGAIYAGLGDLTKLLLGRTYTRKDGVELSIKHCLIDARWGEMTEVVKKFARSSEFSSVIMPSFGQYFGPMETTFEKKQKGTERIGLHWKIPAVKLGESRHVVYDANFWKSFMAQRLFAGVGDRSSLTFFDEYHNILADHFTAEHCTPIESKGRRMDVWKLRPNRTENHLFDACVMAHVAASILNISIESHTKKRRTRSAERPKTAASSWLDRVGN